MHDQCQRLCLSRQPFVCSTNPRLANAFPFRHPGLTADGSFSSSRPTKDLPFSVILSEVKGPLAAATFVEQPKCRSLNEAGSGRHPGLKTPGYDAEVPEGTEPESTVS
jgi:hypothetical protein